MQRADEDDWLKEWIDRWDTRIMQLAFQLTRNRDFTQDVAQEVSLRLYLQHRKDPNKEITGAQLLYVIKNVVRNMGRLRRLTPFAEVTYEPTAESFEQCDHSSCRVSSTRPPLAPQPKVPLTLLLCRLLDSPDCTRNASL